MKPLFRALSLALCALFPTHSAQAATVNITYTDDASEGFNDAARGPARRAAFEAAAGLWGSRITSSVSITISAHFDPLGGTTNSALLATCGPNSVFHDWSNSATAPLEQTWYPSALANKLAGRDLDSGDTDMDVTCNSDVDNATVLGTDDWYYGTDGNAGNDVDFFSTVMHELGHGLGFISFIGSNGAFSIDGVRPGIYDRFMKSGLPGNRVALTSMTQTERAAALIGDQLVFDGTQTNSANGGSAAKLFAPNPFRGGSSTSHLDETVFTGNNETMTPLASGIAHDPGPVATGIFRDMGWTMGTPDTTPPNVTCGFPTAGVLSGFSQVGAGTATDAPGIDTALVPSVQVHLRLDSQNLWWSNGAWLSTSAPTVERSPQVPSSFNAGTGAWSVALSAWPDSLDIFDNEDYTLFVIASDTAGNQTILTRAIRIDQNPPVVAWSPLTQGATVINLSTAGGTIAQATSVSFQIAEANSPAADRFWTGSAWSTTPTFLPGAISGGTWNRGSTVLPTSAQLRSGLFRLTVRATDASATTVTSTITVTVSNADSTPPTASFATPLTGTAVRALSSINGLVSDNVDGSGVAKVGLFLRRNSDLLNWNGTAWVASAVELPTVLGTNGEGGQTWRSSNLPTGANLLDGSYRASIIPRDNRGNNGTTVISTFTIDRSAPAVAITAPANGAKAAVLLTVSGTCSDTLTGGASGTGVTSVKLTLQRASDGLFWNGSSWVVVTSGGKPPALATVISGAKWSRTTSFPKVSQTPPGTYLLTATAVDKALNNTTVNSSFVIIVDSVLPTVAITSPANGSVFTTLSPFTGTATDTNITFEGSTFSGSGAEFVNLILRRSSDNKTWTGTGWAPSTVILAATLTSTGGSSVSWTFGAAGTPSEGKLPAGLKLVPGTYTLIAKSVDRSGNSSADRVRTFTVSAASSTATESGISLSTISASAHGSVRLLFTGALGSSSTDSSRYSADQNGAIEVFSVQQPSASEIILGTDTLVVGQRLTVTYDLLDSQGRRLAGTAGVTVK